MPNATNPREIGVLLFEHFSNHCLANAIEPLRAANTLARRPLYRWRFLGLDTAPLTSSSGLPVTPEAPLAQHGGDWLLVLPSYGFERHATHATSRALQAAARRYNRLIGLDMGAWLMAEAGLLQGRRATLHWDELDRFAERFPEVTACAERIVDDGDIVTCGGATTAFELMLAQIAAQHGAMLRMEVAALFMQGGPGRADPPPLQSDDSVVESAMALMRRHIEAPLPVAAIARRLGLSPRALERHCARALGQGPAGVYRALRLNAARRMAEDSALPVAEIAARTGYEDASALTRAYRRAFGQTPTGHRAAVASPLPNSVKG